MKTPEYFYSQFAAENRHSSDNDTADGGGGGEHFIVEELLDFSNDDTVIADGTIFNSFNGNSTESSAVTVIESCNSSSFSSCEPNSFFDGGNLTADGQFSSELCVPYDDLAELEWLSNFAEESFSSEDLQKLELISGMKQNPNDSSKTPLTTTTDNRTRNTDNIVSASVSVSVSIPAKAARSKRSRTIPSNWNNSPLLPLSPTTSSSEADIVVFRAPMKKKDVVGDGRKCLHCATDKTPQWRTGPMGPKTLCNACGVRYKSGRLVPEYRPAASPTFVVTKHSNSHRKVMELRRQKGEKQERMLIEYGLEEMMKDDESDDYLIHQHMGPHFRHLI